MVCIEEGKTVLNIKNPNFFQLIQIAYYLCQKLICYIFLSFSVGFPLRNLQNFTETRIWRNARNVGRSTCVISGREQPLQFTTTRLNENAIIRGAMETFTTA